MSDIKIATGQPNDQTHNVSNRDNNYIKDTGHGTPSEFLKVSG